MGDRSTFAPSSPAITRGALRLSRVGLAALALSTALPSATLAAADPMASAQALSSKPLRLQDAWRQQILNRPGPLARPLRVEVEGDEGAAQNAQALVERGHGVLHLRNDGRRTARVILDFGVPVSGTVEVTLARPSSAPLRLAYSEDRRLLTRFGDGSDNPDDFFYHGRTLGTDDDPDARADLFPTNAPGGVLKSPGLRGSQRYIALSLDGPGEAHVLSVRVRQANHRGAYDGHFLSSDPVLNRAWYASAYALDLSTVRDPRRNSDARWVIVDGPKRDRTIYGANIRISGLAGAYLSTDYRAIWRDSLNIFACQQYPDGTLPVFSLVDTPCPLGRPGPPDGPPAGFGPPAEGALARLDTYSAWWVVSLADYLRYTGDTAFAAQMAPVARRILAFFDERTDPSGLWAAADYDGKLAFDWHPPDRLSGRNTFANAVYFAALRAMAEIELQAAHDKSAADRYIARSERVRAALLAKAWDGQAGAMLATADAGPPEHPADANIGAALFGILDPPRLAATLRFLGTQLASPYGTQNTDRAEGGSITQYVSPWLAGQEAVARYQAGDAQGGLDVIRRTFGRMLDYGPGTPWEEMAIDGTPRIPRPGTSLTDGNTVSRVHPWSSAIPPLSMYALGVRPDPAAPGAWLVAPVPGDLAWAQGVVPVSTGRLSVAWSRGPTGRDFILTVDVPRDVKGVISVPLLGCARDVALDGRPFWRSGRAIGGATARLVNGHLVVGDLSGRHTFAWAQAHSCNEATPAAGRPGAME